MGKGMVDWGDGTRAIWFGELCGFCFAAGRPAGPRPVRAAGGGEERGEGEGSEVLGEGGCRGHSSYGRC